MVAVVGEERWERIEMDLGYIILFVDILFKYIRWENKVGTLGML